MSFVETERKTREDDVVRCKLPSMTPANLTTGRTTTQAHTEHKRTPTHVASQEFRDNLLRELCSQNDD